MVLEGGNLEDASVGQLTCFTVSFVCLSVCFTFGLFHWSWTVRDSVGSTVRPDGKVFVCLRFLHCLLRHTPRRRVSEPRASRDTTEATSLSTDWNFVFLCYLDRRGAVTYHFLISCRFLRYQSYTRSKADPWKVAHQPGKENQGNDTTGNQGGKAWREESKKALPKHKVFLVFLFLYRVLYGIEC